MDYAAYADLAVRLVNAVDSGQGSGDGLATVEHFRSLVADRPPLASRVTSTDLAALRLLRDEFRLIFTAAAEHNDTELVDRLNALLTRHPIHQQITRHDGQRWHIHLVDSGSVADRYAAAAVAGLTGLVTESGSRRLRVCAGPGCERVFIIGPSGREKPYCSARCAPGASVRALRSRGRSSGHRPAATAAS